MPTPFESRLEDDLARELGDSYLAAETFDELLTETCFDPPTPTPSREPLRLIEGGAASMQPKQTHAVGRLMVNGGRAGLL